MANSLQLGQKLGMSLDDLIKKTQEVKSKQNRAKTEKGGRQNAQSLNKLNSTAKKGVQKKDVTRGPKFNGVTKKNAPQPGKNKTKNQGFQSAPKRVGAPARGPARNPPAQSLSVDDILSNMNSKKAAQKAMKIARRLEAEARKYLGPLSSPRPQRQQQQSRQPVRQNRPTRVSNHDVDPMQWPEPQTHSFLLDNERQSDDEHIEMEVDDRIDVKPNIATLQAQANQFARGVRGQVCV